jgi:hypothetical protein
MNQKTEVRDATDDECLMAAVALLAGSDKTADELILGFRAAKSSPAGVACTTFAAADQADRAVRFASLQAKATDADARQVRKDALVYAKACMAACCGWTVETLGHNIESAFGDELDADECDDIARKALGL